MGIALTQVDGEFQLNMLNISDTQVEVLNKCYSLVSDTNAAKLSYYNYTSQYHVYIIW